MSPAMGALERARVEGPDMQLIGTLDPHRLRHDWERLRHDPAALRRATGWQLVAGPLADLDQLVEITGWRVRHPSCDLVLQRLVELARDDELAARIVLRRLEPDLVHIHRHRSRQAWARRLDVELGDLLTTAWTVIRTYNPARRPTRLASSLVSDVEYREYRAPLRRQGHGQPADPCDFDELASGDPVDPLVELAALVGDPAAELDDADRDLVRRLMSGRRTIDIARELGVTPRTIRNRRDRIAVRLRAVAIAA